MKASVVSAVCPSLSRQLFLTMFVVAVFGITAEVWGQCVAPGAPSFIATPGSAVTVGQTYALSWSRVAEDVIYTVERSADPGFGSSESTFTGGTGASFTSASPGTLYHRVTAAALCDDSLQSAPSETAAVQVVDGAPVVIFTKQPESRIVAVGESVGSSRFGVQNIGRVPVTVAVSGVPESTTFFKIIDPDGGDPLAMSLLPGESRKLDVVFDASTAERAVFSGFLQITGVDQQLENVATAYLELKVGAEGGDAVPEFRVGGELKRTAAFDPFPAGSDDTQRDPLIVQIVNPGSQPIDLVGSIEPEGWLMPEGGWNLDPIPAFETLDVALTTDRSRVSSDAAFPRHSYFTVRGPSGASARLLIEDRASGSTDLKLKYDQIEEWSKFLLPGVVAVQGAGNSSFSTQLRIGNVGQEPLPISLTLVSSLATESLGPYGFTIPSNDVFSVNELVRMFFGGTFIGHVELEVPAEMERFLSVSDDVETFRPVGSDLAGLPVVKEGEGARVGSVHSVPAISPPNTRSNLWLLETSGGPVTVLLEVFDVSGAYGAEATVSVMANQQFLFNNILRGLGLPADFLPGRIDITVIDGEGSVVGMLFTIDNVSAEFLSIQLSQPVDRGAKAFIQANAPGSDVSLVLGAINDASGSLAYTTTLTFVGQERVSDLTVSFVGSRSLVKAGIPVRVEPGELKDIDRILEKLFELYPDTSTIGSIVVHRSGDAKVYGRVVADPGDGLSFIAGELPVIDSGSEALTSVRTGMNRPIYFEGLTQSLDGERGSSWGVALTEVGGQDLVVDVRLYEAANRSYPIATREVHLAASSTVVLDPIFDEMGLDDELHAKERNNVQIVVTPNRGNGIVAAVAIETEKRTGDATRYLLTPSGGVAATGLATVRPVVLPIPEPAGRRRPVARPE